MRYDVCISFEGTHRKYANRLARALCSAGIATFFDEYERPRLWGAFLHDELGTIYYEESHFCIMLLSKEYFTKMYPNRERMSILLRSGKDPEYALPVKMDDCEIPETLRGLGYLDGRKLSPKVVAEEFKKKINLSSQYARESIFKKMSSHRYKEALDEARGYLNRVEWSMPANVKPSTASHSGLMLYNAACCASRLLEDGSISEHTRTSIAEEGLEYALAWLNTPAFRPGAADSHEAVSVFNDDDDLRSLRKSFAERLKQAYRNIGVSRRVRRQASGSNDGSKGGCLGGDTRVLSVRSTVVLSAVKPGDNVLSGFIANNGRAPCMVRNVQIFPNKIVMEINKAIITTYEQQFYEANLGWTSAGELRIGMRLLCDDGHSEPIVSIATRENLQDVYAMSVDSPDRSFSANGLVCHNKE